MSGRNTYKGINSQSYAALSLFLQYVVRSDFKEIQFEQNELEDFVIVFNSGKRLICESKYRKNSLELNELKSILDTVIEHNQMNSDDELLIITEKASDQVKSVVNNFRFFTDAYRDELKNKPSHFEDKHFLLLPKVRLWEVAQLTNRDGILLLMSKVLSSNGSFWIPRDVIEDWVNTLLVNEIYLNSQEGSKLTRSEFLDKIEKRKTKYLENNGVTFEEAKKIEVEKIERVIQLVTSEAPNKRDICANAISELVISPMLHYYLLQKLTKKDDLILEDWETLWRATAQSAYSFELFKIFENNLSTIENQEYALKFINTVLDEYIINYFREDFIKKDVVDVCVKIFFNDRSKGFSIFEVIKKLYEFRASKYLYEEKGRDDSWEREEISSLLKDIYYKTNDKSLKENIVEYIIETFNIVEDDGKFWHYTPPQLFEILKDYVDIDPLKRILWFSQIAAQQYQKFYQRFGKKIKFEGWEHMGGGISQSGSEFSISDKHFIRDILIPALDNIPKEKVWKFIETNLVTEEEEKISFKKPDFLNRMCIPYLIKEYDNGENSERAFTILSSFIKMRHGIPWKPDIIFQEIRNSNLSGKKKWNLVKVSLDSYKQLPVNAFVEQIVTNLAEDSVDSEVQNLAIQVLINWASDPNYKKSRSFGSYDVVDSAFKLLNNPKTFKDGVEILRTQLNSEEFINSKDTYASWDIGKALALVLQKDIKEGISLLENIYGYEHLSNNQQTVTASCLDDLPKSLVVNIYDKFLEPKLKVLGSIQNIERKFSSTNARELFVKYAEKLAEIREYRKSLDMIKIFIEDSDPPKDGSNGKDDPEGKFNKHKQIEEGKENFAINTVRGYCAWALRHFTLLQSRDYIPEAIPLIKELSEDSNYYVRLQATYPLIDLVRNRDTYIPNTDPKERFLEPQFAKRIEEIAFAMLRRSENQKLLAVMKGLVHVFNGMRAIDDIRAEEVLTIFINSGFDEVLDDLAPLIIFFAEFRKNVYNDLPWGKLPDFDDMSFKNLLKEQIKKGKASLRQSLAWQFWRLPNEGKTNKQEYNKDLFLISVAYFKLFLQQDYEHEIWEKIYHFIEDYLPYEFNACFDLWKECVKKERPYLEKASKDKNMLYNVYWWPFFYNGKILLSSYQHLGLDMFLEWVDFMSDYPREVYIANDFGDVVNKLKQLPKGNVFVGKIFDKLIKRDPSYYDDKQEWLNQKNK